MSRTKTRVGGTLFLLCLLLMSPPAAGQRRAAAVLCVMPGGGGDCSDWANACSLQVALAQAAPGDEIWVASGTYMPTGGSERAATFQLQSGVGLYGGFSGGETSREQRDWQAQSTILSGDIGVEGDSDDNSFHVVTSSGADATAVLDGFVITGGNAVGSGGLEGGGGMYNEGGSPTVRNALFVDNQAGWGGGIANLYGSPILWNVTLRDNQATSGGGMASLEGGPALDGVVLSGNTASQAGGGLEQYGGSLAMNEVTLLGNDASQGGGLAGAYASLSVVNATFLGNSATTGGGLYGFEADLVLANVLFSGNTAADAGGAMYHDRYISVREGPGNAAEPIGAPDGGGALLANLTFGGNAAGNAGGALYNRGGGPTLDNCILWGNSAPSGAQMANEESEPVIHASLMEGSGGSGANWDPSLGTDGGGNLDIDPQFENAAGEDGIPGTPDDDMRLPPSSPAVDAGDNDSLPPDVLDLDGDGDTAESLPLDIDRGPRVAAAVVDMGAYETPPPSPYSTRFFMPVMYQTY